jgi:predicted transcriptional regulator YheO
MPDMLQPFVPIADAIATVLKPHVEVVIHDLSSGTVHHIANGMSRRKPGEPSLTELQDVGSLDQPVIGPYRKTNWDGRKLKSITAVLQDASGYPAGLMCINVDVTMFETLQAISRDFLRFSDDAARPSVLFQNDWREEANEIVGQFLTDRGTTLSSMALEERMALIEALDARGLFDVRNAVPHIARVTKLSRATLYKTLKAVRAEASPSLSSNNHSQGSSG